MELIRISLTASKAVFPRNFDERTVPYSKRLKANALNHGINSAFDLVVVHTGYQMAISSHVDATPERHVITGIPV